jgi:hypothetical protein
MSLTRRAACLRSLPARRSCVNSLTACWRRSVPFRRSNDRRRSAPAEPLARLWARAMARSSSRVGTFSVTSWTVLLATGAIETASAVAVGRRKATHAGTRPRLAAPPLRASQRPRLQARPAPPYSAVRGALGTTDALRSRLGECGSRVSGAEASAMATCKRNSTPAFVG